MAPEIEEIITKLSEQQKRELRDLLDRDLKASHGGNASNETARNFAWARGQIRMATDFDEPLEDFKEYME